MISTPDATTEEVLTNIRGELSSWILGDKSRKSQLKMNATISAGTAASFRMPNQSCKRTASDNTMLDRTYSIPADDRKYRKTISVIMMSVVIANRMASDSLLLRLSNFSRS